MQLYNKNMHKNDKHCICAYFFLKQHTIKLTFIDYIYTYIVGFRTSSNLIMTHFICLNQFPVPLPWARTCTRVKSCSLTSSRLCFCRALWITWAVLSWLVNCARNHEKNKWKKILQASWERTETIQFLLNIYRNLK